MKKEHHTSSASAGESVKNSIEKIPENRNISINVKAEESQNVSIESPFVLLFYKNFSRIIVEHTLSKTEILVLLSLLDKMSYGNQFSVSQTAIANELGMDRGNVSRSFNSMIRKGLITKNDEGMFINPNVLAKGLTHKMKKDRLDKFFSAAQTSDLIKNAFTALKK